MRCWHSCATSKRTTRRRAFRPEKDNVVGGPSGPTIRPLIVPLEGKRPLPPAMLNGDCSTNVRVRLVVENFEVVEIVFEDAQRAPLDRHTR